MYLNVFIFYLILPIVRGEVSYLKIDEIVDSYARLNVNGSEYVQQGIGKTTVFLFFFLILMGPLKFFFFLTFRTPQKPRGYELHTKGSERAG